ncbi:MAG: hypothetical protein AB7N80_06975 [Bdellovibrionales bacterium]
MKKCLITAMVLSFGIAASATAPSAESREQMASAHEQMAKCLRSEAPVQDCHQQMREQCQNMKNAEGCPMMGKMGKGPMRNRKANSPTTEK